MCLDHCGSRGWRRERDADLDEGMKAQVAIGFYESSAQAQILQATACFGQCGCFNPDRNIDLDSLAPSVLESVLHI